MNTEILEQAQQVWAQAFEKYTAKIVEDYKRFLVDSRLSIDNIDQKVTDFKNKIQIEEGSKYYKVLKGGRVHSFIVKKDDGKFLTGDILKPASFATPAKNSARGNLFADYIIYWTGPVYLR